MAAALRPSAESPAGEDGVSGGASRGVSRDFLAEFQKVAIGFRGEPVPPVTASGAAVKRKVHRLRLAAALLRFSRSQLSNSGIPIATSNSRWTGQATPSTSEGSTSCDPSLPNNATDRKSVV